MQVFFWLWSVCRSLTTEATRALVQEYAATHFVSRARRHDHITPVIVSLPWFPVRQRIIYKKAVLVWKCLHDATPRYLADLCVPAHSVHGHQQLRSTASGTLLVLRTWSAQLRRHWTTNIEQSAGCTEDTRYDLVLLQASSQGPPVSAVVYAAAGMWAQRRSSGAVVTV